MVQNGFSGFKKYLEEACGIVLGENKQYLVDSRLKDIMKAHGIADLDVLVKNLSAGGDLALKGKIIDAMTTNETSWFRDNYPYDFLKDVVFPECIKKGTKELRVWSAASSSGQEAYSISMVTDEFLKGRPGCQFDVKIAATDISPTMLNNAKNGDYANIEIVRGLSIDRKKAFFKQHGDRWLINDKIKRRVLFRELNLMESYASLGRFDLIFCRNVLIYFSAEVKEDILKRMDRALKPGGYIVLGGSESMSSLSDSFNTTRFKNGMLYQTKNNNAF